jgi:hypothetical protein
MRKEVVFFIVMFALSACTVMLPQVSPKQADWAARQWPGMDATKLENARILYVNRCSGCHNLVLPEAHSLDKWNVILSTMAPRAKLSNEEKEQVRQYIFTAKSVPNQ